MVNLRAGFGAAAVATAILVLLTGGAAGAQHSHRPLSNVVGISQSSYVTEQGNFTVTMEVASTANIQFVYFTFCQLSSPLCYRPVVMTLHGQDQYVGTTNPMYDYNGMTVGVRAGYNITIEYASGVNATEPTEPNPFGNLTIAQSVTGEYMFQMTVMNQLYRLSGVVTDSATGQGISGARVTVSPGNDSPTTTNSVGAYSFPSLPNGTYTVSATASGFPTSNSTVPISGGDTVKDITMQGGSINHPSSGNKAAGGNFLTTPLGLGLVVGVPAVIVAGALMAVTKSRKAKKDSRPTAARPEAGSPPPGQQPG
ncbi:MAG: carboxypeptidase-like regulatory domain-containing protein [Thermoplasmata archaeon]|nr:carboxypeptidase-like regulatory domain-containing protein [Thermoplasmata archaeon]